MEYSGKKASFYTLGCKLNFSETSSIARRFEDIGFERVEFTETADAVVINSCSVTAEGDKKTRNIIRQAVRKNPGCTYCRDRMLRPTATRDHSKNRWR